MGFIAQPHAAPWLCHLSYIKPHWPYIVPAPYHAMYGPDDVLPAVRDAAQALLEHWPQHVSPLLERWLRHGQQYGQV